MFSLEFNNLIKAPQNYGALFNKLGQQTIKNLGIKNLAVSAALISPQEIQEFNKIYRHKNKVTDVLSFEEVNEVVICYAKAKEQAKEHGHSLKKELAILFVHGLLHVLGYEDKTLRGAREMDELGARIISKYRL
ncbi:MAG: rRNA maturation RNase YbeY [Patescibacteria group bacterium]|jgi:probable rRNA maturation factor